jgi:DNA-binding response OmpR family regulator
MDKMNDPISVLLVDDDEEDYVLLKSLFSGGKPPRYDLRWVNSYDAAIGELHSGDFDVCLLDYVLGDRTGIDLLRDVRARGMKNPVIVMAGLENGKPEADALEAGASDYLDKSLIGQLLEKSIFYAIERRKSETLLLKTREELESQVEVKTMELTKAKTDLREAAENMELFSHTISRGLRNPAFDLNRLAKRLMEGYHESLGENGKAYCELLMRTSEHIVSMAENMKAYIKTNEPRI